MLYNNSHLHGNGQEPGLYTPLPQVINKKIRHNSLCLGAIVETGKCAGSSHFGVLSPMYKVQLSEATMH